MEQKQEWIRAMLLYIAWQAKNEGNNDLWCYGQWLANQPDEIERKGIDRIVTLITTYTGYQLSGGF